MPWPAGSAFNTTISFDVSVPDAMAPNGSWQAACDLSWNHTALPGTSTLGECVGVGYEGDTDTFGTGDVYFGIGKCRCDEQRHGQDVT